jgi:predicted lipoprotein with Yx(FWY)xxD motif
MRVRTPITPLRIALGAALVSALVIAGGSWAASGTRHVMKPATVQTRTIKKLGTVLVNSRGFTLYIFVPDHHAKVTCKGGCAAVWPPLKVKAGQKPSAGGAAKKKLLGLDGRVVTYNHWPLYTYVIDKRPGQAKGQAVKDSFGLWYVISPSGKVIKTKP